MEALGVIEAQAIAPPGQVLPEQQVLDVLQRGLGRRFAGQRVLCLIPDHTRSIPLPMLFRALVDTLAGCKSLDFMVALGTHPPLSEAELHKLVGITDDERTGKFRSIGLLNHSWDQAASLTSLGVVEEDEIRLLAGSAWHPTLPSSVEIRINKAVLEHDAILIVGPTFPHEVAGFSGGAKYLFPGISGPEMIDATHWLGALSGVVRTIGISETPVRAMIHAAARRLQTPITLAALIVEGHDLSGIFIGDAFTAWRAAADLSSERHIRWFERRFRRVLSCAPPMYDELWTAAKAMYKLEPVIERGGELVLYAPHLDTVSRVHGRSIYEVGYHILPYFLGNWDRFKHVPLGVLAHSTHLRGSGVLKDGAEVPNVRVSLASRISAEDCAHLNLGYVDPSSVKVEEWQGREGEGVLYVPRAGEILYRAKECHGGTV